MTSAGPSSSPQRSNHSNTPDSSTLYHIHQRYEDTAQVIFRHHQKYPQENPSYFSVQSEASKRYAYSRYGNAAVVVRKSGRDMTKMDERPIQSSFCVIM